MKKVLFRHSQSLLPPYYITNESFFYTLFIQSKLPNVITINIVRHLNKVITILSSENSELDSANVIEYFKWLLLCNLKHLIVAIFNPGAAKPFGNGRIYGLPLNCNFTATLSEFGL